MTTALDAMGIETPPLKGAIAVCQECGQPVRAKCGSIVTPHWAHFPRTDPDSFSEGETAWHLGWKALVQAEQQEVVIMKAGHTHRADLMGKHGIVVELQHSPISPEEATKREDFYGDMIWVFDAAPFRDHLSFTPPVGRWPHCRLSWRRERFSIVNRTRPTYLDLGDNLLFWLHPDYGKGIGTLNQHGTLIRKGDFLTETFGDLLSPEGVSFVKNPGEFQPLDRQEERAHNTLRELWKHITAKPIFPHRFGGTTTAGDSRVVRHETNQEGVVISIEVRLLDLWRFLGLTEAKFDNVLDTWCALGWIKPDIGESGRTHSKGAGGRETFVINERGLYYAQAHPKTE